MAGWPGLPRLGLHPVRLDRDDSVGGHGDERRHWWARRKAGLHQGDVIAAWNGKPIASITPCFARSTRQRRQTIALFVAGAVVRRTR